MRRNFKMILLGMMKVDFAFFRECLLGNHAQWEIFAGFNGFIGVTNFLDVTGSDHPFQQNYDCPEVSKKKPRLLDIES